MIFKRDTIHTLFLLQKCFDIIKYITKNIKIFLKLTKLFIQKIAYLFEYVI